MIVMGALHAAPVEEGEDLAGVLTLNCSVLEYCGECLVRLMVNPDNNAFTGCPGEPMIPWYLILGGCLTIVLLVVRVLLARVGDHMSH